MKTFTVIYRTGGTDRFEWRKVWELYLTRDAARQTVSDLANMGYPALIHPTQQLDAIGLPSTYEASV